MIIITLKRLYVALLSLGCLFHIPLTPFFLCFFRCNTTNTRSRNLKTILFKWFNGSPVWQWQKKIRKQTDIKWKIISKEYLWKCSNIVKTLFRKEGITIHQKITMKVIQNINIAIITNLTCAKKAWVVKWSQKTWKWVPTCLANKNFFQSFSIE